MERVYHMPKRVTDQTVLGKMFSTGLDLLSIAEEGVRKPSKLPRDVAAHLAKFLDRQKDEIMLIVRDEIRYALSTMPLAEIAKDVLAGHEININLTMTKKKPRKQAASRSRKH